MIDRMLTPDTVLQALTGVLDPNTNKDFVSSRAIKNLVVTAEGGVSFELALGYPARSQEPLLRATLINAVKQLSGVTHVSVNVVPAIIAHAVQEITIAGNLLEMFQHIVAVGADRIVRGAKSSGSVLIESMAIAGA